MSKPRKTTRPRPWVPLAEARPVPPTAQRIAAARAFAERLGEDPDAAEALVNEDVEMWKNDRYTVIVRRFGKGPVRELSIRRNDRKPDMPWRHLQRIKSELAGDEAEAVELYPAESRLVDTANQRWLWVMPPGVHWPVGFDTGRHVYGPEHADDLGARQAPLEEGERDDG